MIDDGSTPPWWQATRRGRELLLGFLKIDRKGATEDWAELPGDAVLARRRDYTASIEQIARDSGSPPPAFQGDGTMIFFWDGETGGPRKAFDAARLLWQRMRVDLNVPVRIAVHAGAVAWDQETGKLAHAAIDHCGHLEAAVPAGAIGVSEDVFLLLPKAEQDELAAIGMTRRDGLCAYVFPRAAGERKDPALFVDDPDAPFRAAFRGYALGAEVRKLRYVGFRLTKREPPCLDVDEVFIEMRMQLAARLAPASATSRSLARRRRATEESPWALREAIAAEGPSLSVAYALRRSRCQVVLAGPGSGKTTLLRWLAVCAARGPLELIRQLGIGERLLPVIASIGRLAELRADIGGHASVIDVLARHFQDRSLGSDSDLGAFLQRELEAGRCLVLLDGLDEVVPEQRKPAAAWLEAFAARFPRNRFVATSRQRGYSTFALPGAAELLLLPFTHTQVSRFVTTFHRAYARWETGADDPAGAAQGAERFLAALRGNPRLSGLARNPFLLSALALIHRAEGQIPRHRVQAYAMMARTLCETWGAARRLVAGEAKRDVLYEEEGLPILGELALKMHEHWPTGAAPKDFIVRTLGAALHRTRGLPADEATRVAEDFLVRASEAAQILVESGPSQWGFFHLTFQEFFAAAGLHAKEKFEKLALLHLREPRWEEIIRLGVGFMVLVQGRPEAARRFVEQVLPVGLRRHKLDKAAEQLAEMLHFEPPRTVDPLAPLLALLAVEAGEALPGSRHDQIAKRLVGWLRTVPWSVSGPVLSQIAVTDFARRVAARLLDEVLRPVEKPLGWTREAALSLLRRDVETKRLHQGATSDDPAVRARALSALGAAPDENAVDVLLGGLRDQNESCRARAAESLGKVGAQKAREALLAALDDESFLVRGHAAEALGQLGDQSVAPTLVALLKAPESFVRWEAAAALGQLGDLRAVSPLLDRLGDADSFVRAQAARALGELWTAPGLDAMDDPPFDDDSWRPWIRGGAIAEYGRRADSERIRSALKDESPYVRWQAVRAASSLPAEEATAVVIEALGDSESFVREAAAAALAWFRSESAVQALLAALDDADEWVRREAATSLGEMEAAKAAGRLRKLARSEDAAAESARLALGAIARAHPSRRSKPYRKSTPRVPAAPRKAG